MKQITITKKIHPNSFELEILRKANMCDIINLSECEFACSEAQEIIISHPRTKSILSKDIKEQIAFKFKGE